MRPAGIAIVVMYDADVITKEQAEADAQEIANGIVFTRHEYHPFYASEPYVDPKYDRDAWIKP